MRSRSSLVRRRPTRRGCDEHVCILEVLLELVALMVRRRDQLVPIALEPLPLLDSLSPLPGISCHLGSPNSTFNLTV